MQMGSRAWQTDVTPCSEMRQAPPRSVGEGAQRRQGDQGRPQRLLRHADVLRIARANQLVEEPFQIGA